MLVNMTKKKPIWTLRKHSAPARSSPRAPLPPPWVDEIDVAVGKIVDIPSRELRSARSGDGGDLGIGVADGLTKRAAMSRNPREITRRVALKTENPSCEVLCKHGFCRSQQAFAFSAFAEQLNAIEDLGFRDCGRAQVRCGLFLNPGDHTGMRFALHEL